jgi:hypothetical protein
MNDWRLTFSVLRYELRTPFKLVRTTRNAKRETRNAFSVFAIGFAVAAFAASAAVNVYNPLATGK